MKKIRMILVILLMSFSVHGAKDHYVYTYNNNKDIKIHVIKGDITQLSVDAIVNAANEEFLAGGGVCGVIFAAAGKEKLQEACIEARKKAYRSDESFVGRAIITDSFDLEKVGIKKIIHAVGPKIPYGSFVTGREATNLFDAYKNSLYLAEWNNLRSIAFPVISSGIYGYPKEAAIKVALEVFADYIISHKETPIITDIYLALFTQEDLAVAWSVARSLPGYLRQDQVVYTAQ